MTSTTGVRRRAGSTARVESSRRSGRSGRGGPVTVLQIYAVVLVVIPPTQIIGPLGAVGTPATVIGLGALVLWALGTLTPHHHLHRTVVPLRVVLGLVIGTILLGYTVLHSRFVPVNELMSSDRMLLQVLSWIGVGMLAAEGLADLGEVYRVLRALTAAVTVMAVVGILQFRFGIDLAELMGQIPGLHQNVSVASIQDRDGFRRPAGTATHPIEFGCVIAMAMPLALHLARFDMVSSRFRRWAPVFVIAMGIPVAVSRSAVLGAVVALVVIIAGLEPKLRPRALGAVAAFVLAIYVTTPGLLGTLRNLFLNAGEDTSVTSRTSDYEIMGEYVRQSPVIGRGPGTFLPTSYLFLDNQYLLTVVELGLLGLLVMTSYLLAAAFLGRGARHRSEDPAIRDLGQAMAATSLVSAVTAFTFDAFSFLMYAGFVPLALGAAGALWAMTRDRVPDARAGDRRTEDVCGGDPGPARHEPRGTDEQLQWLTSGDAESLGLGATASGGEAGDRPMGAHDDTPGSRRVVTVVGAGIALVLLLAGTAVAVGTRVGDDRQTATARMPMPTAPAPPGESTAPSGATTAAAAPPPGGATESRSTSGIATSTGAATTATTPMAGAGLIADSGSSATRPVSSPVPQTTAGLSPTSTTMLQSTTTTTARSTTTTTAQSTPTTTTTTPTTTTTTTTPASTTTPRPGQGPP
jgi:hypothetical protein